MTSNLQYQRLKKRLDAYVASDANLVQKGILRENNLGSFEAMPYATLMFSSGSGDIYKPL